jgi:hypothetical protein
MGQHTHAFKVSHFNRWDDKRLHASSLCTRNDLGAVVVELCGV